MLGSRRDYDSWDKVTYYTQVHTALDSQSQVQAQVETDDTTFQILWGFRPYKPKLKSLSNLAAYQLLGLQQNKSFLRLNIFICKKNMRLSNLRWCFKNEMTKGL